MSDDLRLKVNFYRSESGTEPVRDWLQSLSKNDKKIIGEDIKTVQFAWPLGLPLIRKIETNLWEVRSNLENRITRVLFTVVDDHMILLHGFIKKSQKIPKDDIKLAKQRFTNLRSRR